MSQINIERFLDFARNDTRGNEWAERKIVTGQTPCRSLSEEAKEYFAETK